MPQHAAHFADDTLFSRVARAVCAAGVLPRKELYESWEVARRVARRTRAAPIARVVDWACGHGLLAHLCALLDERVTVIGFDRRLPPSSTKLRTSLLAVWPALDLRVALTTVPPRLAPDDVVVSCHACGALTDEVLARAVSVRARVAVLPCCHDLARLDDGGLSGWLDTALAIDVARAGRLRAEGYRVWTARIPEEITPKNRLLFGMPE